MFRWLVGRYLLLTAIAPWKYGNYQHTRGTTLTLFKKLAAITLTGTFVLLLLTILTPSAAGQQPDPTPTPEGQKEDNDRERRTVPSSPTNLSLNALSTSIRFYFTSSYGATYHDFELHRATTANGSYSRVATRSSNFSPVSFGNQARGYWYKARAMACDQENDCSPWAWSNVLAHLPSPPSIYSTSFYSTTSGRIRVDYLRGNTTYGNQFTLYRSTTKNGTYMSAGTASVNDWSSPSYLTLPERGYWYKVAGRACRVPTGTGTGCGAWGTHSNSVHWEAAPPGPPTNLQISINSYDSDELDVTYDLSGPPDHYVFELHQSTSQHGHYTRYKVASDSGYLVTFEDLTTDRWYKAQGKNCTTASLTTCGHWSAWTHSIYLNPPPTPPNPLNPPTALTISINAYTDTSLDVNYTQSGSPHKYQFQLYRSETEIGNYTLTATKNYTNTNYGAAIFNNQTRGYWYKAQGKKCRTSALTDCGTWGDYSPPFYFPIPTITPPTGLTIATDSTNSNQINATFTLSTTVTSYTYHTFELHRARVKGDFSLSKSSTRFGAVTSPISFTAYQGYWYKARSKACTYNPSGVAPCGPWSTWSNVISPPITVFNYSPNPLSPGASSNIWTVQSGVTSVYVEVYFSAGEDLTGAIKIQRVTSTGALWTPETTYRIASHNDGGLIPNAQAGWHLRVDVDSNASAAEAPLATLDFHSGTGITGTRIASAFVQMETQRNTISIRGTDLPVREGDNLVFTVQATSALTSPATIQYSIGGTANSSDYTDTSTNPGTITIASDSDSNTIVINTIENDDAGTASETITVTLDSVSGQGVTLADSGTVKTGVIVRPVSIAAISDDRWTKKNIIAHGEPTWIWLQVETMPTGATSQDYTNRAYLVKINGNPTGNELPTTPATILTAITGPSTNIQPTGYASLGHGQAKWEEGSSPPEQRDIFLAVQPPTTINTLENYEVTVSKPNFAVIDSPRITTDGTTGTATAKRGHVTIRVKVGNFTTNSSETFKHSREIDIRCVESDSAFESRPDSYSFFKLRDNDASPLIAANAEKEVEIPTICSGAGFLSGNTVRAEAKINLTQQWVQSSTTITWPFSMNTLWGPQNTVTGGLQIFADDLNCTLSFPLEIRQAGGTPTQAASTTAHCTKAGNTWEQGSHPRGNEANVSLGTTFATLLPSANSSSCGIRVANGGYAITGCRKGDQAYATGARPTTAATVFGPEQQNSPQQYEGLLIEHFGRSGTQEWTIVGARPPHLGDTVNKVGRATGWTSGTIVRTYEAHRTDLKDPTCPGSKLGHSDNNAGSIYWECIVTTTLEATGGDSGSPVFVLDDNPNTPNTIEIALVGVLIGGDAVTGNTWFIPIERIYAESLLQDYDWATENLRPLPELNDSTDEHLSLDKRDWTIKATFEKTDFSNGPGLSYHAALHRKDSSTVSPVSSSSGSTLDTQLSQTAKIATFNISDIPLTQRSGEFSVKVKLCVRENLTSNSNVSTKCGDYGQDGGRSLKLPPPAPQNLQAVSNTSSNSVNLTWDQVTGTAKYEVKYRTAGSTAVESSQETSSTTTQVSGLTCDQSYEFSVRAYGSGTGYSADWGPSSQPVNATVRACTQRRSARSSDEEKDLVPPPAPEGLTATPAGPRAIELAWIEVPAARHYRVETAVRDTNQWTEYPEDITDTARTVSDLLCGTSYDFRVSAFGDGVSYTPEWSEPSDIAGGTTGVCNRPPEFGASSYTFSIPEDANSGTLVAELSAEDLDEDPLTYAITGGNAAAKFALTPNQTPAYLTVAAPLDHETTPTYALTIESQDGNGGTAITNVVIHVTDVVETAPPAPSDLSAAATQNTVTLSWRTPDDQTVTGYRILRKGPGQTEFEVHVTDTANTETQYIDTVEVNPDTIYEYMVKAINAAGAGLASNAATVQTPAAP